jgi:acetyl esterase/lipase
VRIYAPRGAGPFPVIVYTHGGGWVIATNDTYDSSARALCNAVGAVVMSVEYRKAPEHRFPAAHEDAYTAYVWALANAAEIDGDPHRIALAGESAGANLAISTAVIARDRGVRMPAHILAVYPIADGNTDSESYEENADAKPLNRPMMQWFLNHYLRGAMDAGHPLISLIHADLHGLPPVTLIAAEIDPLRSDSDHLYDRLRDSGVPVKYHLYKGRHPRVLWDGRRGERGAQGGEQGRRRAELRPGAADGGHAVVALPGGCGAGRRLVPPARFVVPAAEHRRLLVAPPRVSTSVACGVSPDRSAAGGVFAIGMRGASLERGEVATRGWRMR